MRTLAVLVLLSVSCLAQRPQPCRSPRLMTGDLSIATQSENLMAVAKYTYDAWGQKIRFSECGLHHDQSFHLDVLLLYRQRVMYKINYKTRTCRRKRLNTHFHPVEIPKNASLLRQTVIGSSSAPGQGVLVNTWTGELEMKNGTAKYLNTVTEFGCIPVSTLFHTNTTGWVVTSFFNNVLGIRDPQHLIPPSFCEGAQLEEEDAEEPATFFSFF